jgi:hypothetical protein
MRTQVLRSAGDDGLSPFERLKRDLETVDCETGLFWWSEIRRLPGILEPDERMELMVSSQLFDQPALAVVTDRRLLVVSEERSAFVPHGTTTRLEAKEDWAGDIELRFVTQQGEVVLKDLGDEGDAPGLYARLREQDRVPNATGKKGAIKKLGQASQSSWLPGSVALPDPTRGLRVIQRRWVLRAIDETGPRRRSLPWIAHALFMAAGFAVAFAVVALIVLVIVGIVLLVIYA